MADDFRMRLNSTRELLLEQAVTKSRFGSKAEAVEAALTHYVQSIDNVEENKSEIGPEEARRWQTDAVKVIVQGRAEY